MSAGCQQLSDKGERFLTHSMAVTNITEQDAVKWISLCTLKIRIINELLTIIIREMQNIVSGERSHWRHLIAKDRTGRTYV